MSKETQSVIDIRQGFRALRLTVRSSGYVAKLFPEDTSSHDLLKHVFAVTRDGCDEMAIMLQRPRAKNKKALALEAPLAPLWTSNFVAAIVFSQSVQNELTIDKKTYFARRHHADDPDHLLSDQALGPLKANYLHRIPKLALDHYEAQADRIQKLEHLKIFANAAVRTLNRIEPNLRDYRDGQEMVKHCAQVIDCDLSL